MMLHIKYQGSRLCCFRQRRFHHVFPKKAYVKHMTPRDGTSFEQTSSFANILMGKRELVALLNLSSWCLMIVVWLFLAVPWVCLQFAIVVFPDHTHLLFLVEVYLVISRLLAFWFQTRRFLEFSSRKSIFSHCDLDMQ